jgi:predicted nucleic acid-binding Zn ribbon protein
MPVYIFKCPSCNIEVKILQSMKAADPVCQRCIKASCGAHTPEMKKLISIPSRPQFKGKGFYETDYRKPEKGLPEEFKPGLKQGNKKTDWELTQNKDGSGSLMKKNKKKKENKNST